MRVMTAFPPFRTLSIHEPCPVDNGMIKTSYETSKRICNCLYSIYDDSYSNGSHSLTGNITYRHHFGVCIFSLIVDRVSVYIFMPG